MVASNATQDKTPLPTTRQMLDDLDALMERMLSVPVADAEPTVAAPKLSARLTLLEPARQPPAPMPARKPVEAPVMQETPSAPPPAIAAPVASAHYTRVPATELEPISNDVLPPSMLPRITQLLSEIPDEAPSALGMIHAPLWWINVAFDGCTHLLGRPGAFLRDAGGRLIVGLLGVVLAILAAGWFAKDWWGWTW